MTVCVFAYLMELLAINEPLNDKYSWGFNERLNYKAVENLSVCLGVEHWGNLVWFCWFQDQLDRFRMSHFEKPHTLKVVYFQPPF